ncbi:SpoIIE family protein phosphatase [Streptomyces javensis]|uniref:SpoIIE family protein phosphatase n=1 Tax=Streptomyces javensis TaxID=114698 RepID=UPI001FE4E424|nr:SpoIIE family protein phosphatase [Streptomyces javensis]
MRDTPSLSGLSGQSPWDPAALGSEDRRRSRRARLRHGYSRRARPQPRRQGAGHRQHRVQPRDVRLRCREQGQVSIPDVPPGPLPGIEPDALHTSMEIPLPPGSALLLSTDGLVETPGSTSTSHSRSRPTTRDGQRRHHRTS